MAPICGIANATTDLRDSAGRRNILVAVTSGARTWVSVRYSYTETGVQKTARDEWRDADRRVCAIGVRCPDTYDATALNQIGRPGAFRCAPDWPAIRRAVARLRAEHGDLPVQINEWRGRF